MPKPNKSECKNDKKTDLLVQGAGSPVQNFQITVATKISLNNKVCIQTDISYLCLAKYASLKQNYQNI